MDYEPIVLVFYSLKRSCPRSLRLIPTAWKPSKISSFQSYMRGACHGLYALFLSVSASRACMAVRHASLGVAERLRSRVSDDTGAPRPTAKAHA